MGKKKLKLETLKVKSMLTEMTPEDMQHTKGGYIDIKDKTREIFVPRWTEVKTQVDTISNIK